MARALCIKAKNMRYFLNIRDGRKLLVDPNGTQFETVDLAI